MGRSEELFAGSGLTRAHTIGLVVPLLVALSPPILSRYTTLTDSQPFNALVAGAVVMAAAYGLLTWIGEKTNVTAKAVLMGLLIAEIMVLKPYGALPTMGTITLWLFFYYHTMEHE